MCHHQHSPWPAVWRTSWQPKLHHNLYRHQWSENPAGTGSNITKSSDQQGQQHFPNTKIVMSTLLPRKDFHPKTILGISASMSRDCALRSNVYLAHHPTLNMDNLYDNIHLKKENISTFARTLKDTALGRIPTSNHQNRGEDRTQAAPTRTQGPAHRRRERRAPPHQHPQHLPSQPPGHGTTRESPEHCQGTPEYLPRFHFISLSISYNSRHITHSWKNAFPLCIKTTTNSIITL